MNIAIIGAGLIGRKRARALPRSIKLSVICDIDRQKAEKFALDFNCQFETDWQKVVNNPKIHAIIVSTTNKFLAPISRQAILNRKHILVEKPGARNLTELKKVAKVYKKNTVVMFGFNHRYHPAIALAKRMINSNKYGKVLFIRAKYGHGGRLGYENEWRFNKDLAGGGELLDQGTHLIDLVNYFCGQLNVYCGLITNLYWNAELEDSSFFILGQNKGPIAHLSATCVEWKNIFCFEIMLQTAKIQIDGFGGSYGTERLTLYKMKLEMGPPVVKEFSFDGEDISWCAETKEFINRIKKRLYDDKAFRDVIYVLKVIQKIYGRNHL